MMTTDPTYSTTKWSRQPAIKGKHWNTWECHPVHGWTDQTWRQTSV